MCSQLQTAHSRRAHWQHDAIAILISRMARSSKCTRRATPAAATAAAAAGNGRGRAARRRRATSVTKQDARRGRVDGGLAVCGHWSIENGTGPD